MPAVNASIHPANLIANAHADSGARVIEIKAKKFEFAPSEITLKKELVLKLLPWPTRDRNSEHRDRCCCRERVASSTHE